MTAAHIDRDGVWCQVLRRPAGGYRRPALFLDRDGVVNEDTDYLHRVEDLRLIPGAARTIAAANRRRLPVVLVTNQGGIGLGRFGWPDFARLQDALLARLRARGALVDAVFACPYHPRGTGPLRHPDHPDRKPRPGMLLRAAAALDLDLGKSWIVGDKLDDLAAGRAAGLAGSIHVLDGHGRAHRARARLFGGPRYRVILVHSLGEAAHRLPILAPTPSPANTKNANNKNREDL